MLPICLAAVLPALAGLGWLRRSGRRGVARLLIVACRWLFATAAAASAASCAAVIALWVAGYPHGVGVFARRGRDYELGSARGRLWIEIDTGYDCTIDRSLHRWVPTAYLAWSGHWQFRWEAEPWRWEPEHQVLGLGFWKREGGMVGNGMFFITVVERVVVVPCWLGVAVAAAPPAARVIDGQSLVSGFFLILSSRALF